MPDILSVSVTDETLEYADPHRTLGIPVYMLCEQGRSPCSDLLHVLLSGDM
jgi:hypothetical protein